MENHTLVVNEERFWAKVAKSEGCWQWTAAILNGYGRFGIWQDGKQRSGLAHRIAYELSGKSIPPGMFLDHTCHNKACVNPSHLRLATNKQNLENLTGATRASRSGVRGVSWSARAKLWRISVVHHGERYGGQYFKSIADAEAAVIALRNQLFTHNILDRA